MVAAEDIYVAQNAAGSDSGADANNAHSLSWLNTSTNWAAGSGKVSSGDTVHLCGTLTNTLIVRASGEAQNRITLLFEKDANMTSPAWPGAGSGGVTGGAIYLARKNYITIDGGENGLIQNTDNGTDLGNQSSSIGILAETSSFLTVQNLSILNMFVRTSTTNNVGGGTGIRNTCYSYSGLTGFTVTNCVISHCSTGIDSDYGAGCSNYTFTANTISHVNWGGRCGDRNTNSTMTGLVISNNRIHTFTNWNDTVSNNYHHNGFYGWAESGGLLSDVRAFGNYIGPDFGGSYSTSGLHFSGGVSNVMVYNNLFVEKANDCPADGLVYLHPNSKGRDLFVFNNTFIGKGVGRAFMTTGGSCTYTFKNNLASGVATLVLFNQNANAQLVSDYNIGYNLNPNERFSSSTTSSSQFKTWAQWQALGYDLHSSASDPTLNENYMLMASSPAIGQGEDLSTYFTTDKAGVTRNGNWDIGAYAYIPSGPSRAGSTRANRVIGR